MTVLTSRRAVLQGAACSAVAGPVLAQTAGLIEPSMRLNGRTPSGTTVALTFDACPGHFDMRIASALIETSTPASIFVTGAWIRHNPEAVVLLRAHPALFALENHGDRHFAPVLGDRRVFGIRSAGDLAAIQDEIVLGAAAVKGLTGVWPGWYRGATGFYTPQVVPAIERWGYALGAYSLNADHGASFPAETVTRRMAAAVDGDVIVAHINQPTRSSGQGVANGVRALNQRGVRFVRLDRLRRSDVTYGLN
jgi:peptidoglycan/xylan/chitin deacetylase (PgdA/CDA1 family)